MSVLSIPIANRLYRIGCSDGQEERIINLGNFIDSKARAILNKMGPLPENTLLSTLCIVLADEIDKQQNFDNILEKIEQITKRIKILNNKN